MLAPRRLPGIRIDVAPPPPTEALPRMDVAVFVGFAAAGPAHIPVAVESIAHYAGVFGEDLPLAFDAGRGERAYANLGPAVRAFFSGGGRRCWVVRVARTAGLEALWGKVPGRTPKPGGLAAANRFAVPGVLALSAEGRPAPALLQARSVGSWSDPLRLAAALAAAGFALEDCGPLPSSPGNRFRFGTRAALQAGELIELGDAAGVADGAAGGGRVYAIIDQAAPGADANGLPQWQVEATLCAAFEPVAASLFPGSPPTPVNGLAEVAGVAAAPVQATLEAGSAAGLRLRFALPKPSGLAEGQWIRWSDDAGTAWLRIDSLDSRPARLAADTLDVVAEGPAWREVPPLLAQPRPTRAAALSLDVQVSNGPSRFWRLSGVGLTLAHPQGWWRQVSDDVFYAMAAYGTEAPAANPANPFPLAAEDRQPGDSPPLAWIPLGAAPLYGAAVGPLPQQSTALERDGLSRFDAELFLDPELAGLGADALAGQADVIRFLADAPRNLFGMHAALSIGNGGLFNEASLIAVPDAAHLGWVEREAPQPPAVPQAQPKPPAHWLGHRGPCAAAPAGPLPDAPDFGRFLDCATRQLAQPVLSGPGGPVPRGVFRLSWQTPESVDGFILEEALGADFADARELYRGSAREQDVFATREGVFYYRATAFAGDEASAASAALAVVVCDDAWVLKTPEDFQAGGGEAELLRLQRALLRLAAASGDLFAVLGLPRHYRAPEAVRHASSLRGVFPGLAAGDSAGLAPDERRVLSYGALYHPWIEFAAQPPGLAGLRASPPDGIALGLLASRASSRGAWVAPANQPFNDVVALTPPIGMEAWAALQEAQVNLVRADPRGFLTLAADTLSDEPDWRPINVRRLFILLRRLAVRQGASYVFEPNDEVLRRAVERGFTVLLADLFRRGAFAGATAAESFSVAAGGALDTAADRELGRFFVELRVAPARPLEFLAVRLVQSGERLTVTEEG